MAGITDQDWDDFLNSDGEEEVPPSKPSTPFAGSEEEAVDPLIFVNSNEAPELRAKPRDLSNESQSPETEPIAKPYFLEVSPEDSSRAWVPQGSSAESKNSLSNTQIKNYANIGLRAVLFAIPMLIIITTFTIALNFA